MKNEKLNASEIGVAVIIVCVIALFAFVFIPFLLVVGLELWGKLFCQISGGDWMWISETCIKH